MEKVFKPVPDVEALCYKGTPDKPDIKIFVSHRIDLDSETIDNPLYIPVRCGAVYDEREGVTMLGDDTGENISEKRESFCELTVLYWAWKNIDADYYGLCHYRRFLSFSSDTFDINKGIYPWGCVSEKAITEKAIEKFKLTYDDMYKQIISADVITAEPVNLQFTDGNWKSNTDYIKNHPNDFETSDISLLKSVIHDLTPEFDDYTEKYFSEQYSNWYNCYIIKKNIFTSFCEFLFKILFEFEKRLDTTYYSKQKLRGPGFFGEHLWGIYLLYLQNRKNVKPLVKQIVFFEKTEAQEAILPLDRGTFKEIIPIVLMSSDHYVPYLSTFLYSLINTSSPENFYDIIILQKGISELNKKKLKQTISCIPNFSIRFYNPYLFVANSTFHIASSSYCEEAYYRLLTPWILDKYEKALVMDCDIIAKKDVAQLFAISIKGYYLAGVKDIVFQGMLNAVDISYLPYCKKELRMADPYSYINTGVLVMNLSLIRKEFNASEIVEFSETHKFRIQEQDIINSLMQDKVKYIDLRWNMYVENSPWITACIENAPAQSSKYYRKYCVDPFLIHYANNPKPWDSPEQPFAIDFWNVAKETSFYEIMIERMIYTKLSGVCGATFDLQCRMGLFDTRSGARKLADKLLPIGTKRRKLAKILLPKGSLRWRFCKQIYYIFKPQYRPPNSK